ncbi:MAG: tetratricopeptide repeat protein [Planctomycetaceae bacterium]
MIGHRRFPTLLGLLIGAVSLAGCVTDGEPTAGAPGFPWITVSDVPQSRRDLKNASRLDLSYAQYQEQSGNLPEAEQAYRRALGEDPESLDARLGLARIAYRSGRSAEAEKALREIQADVPGNPLILAALGQYLAGEKRWGESLSLLERAADAAPDEPLYRHHFAVALARSGDMARAFDEFAKVHGEAEAHYRIASLHREQGRHKPAETELMKALELRPDLSAAQQMLDDVRRGRDERDSLAERDAAPASPVIQAAAEIRPDSVRDDRNVSSSSFERKLPSK